MDLSARKVKQESKAIPKFFSVADITKLFDENPAALYAYVQTGLSKRAAVMGVHLAQLARMVGVPLLHDGTFYEELPAWSWVDPSRFKNIGPLLLKAKEAFSIR